MEGFLTFILIAILSFYVLGQVGKWMLRRWVARKQREMGEMFGADGGAFRQYTRGGNGRREAKREGEVEVQRPVQPEKKVGKNVGDYVEYEEVECVSDEETSVN